MLTYTLLLGDGTADWTFSGTDYRFLDRCCGQELPVFKTISAPACRCPRIRSDLCRSLHDR